MSCHWDFPAGAFNMREPVIEKGLPMITRDLLRSIRNDLPMAFTIRQLGNMAPYSKSAEGRFRFQCPHCGEILAAVNPRNNLAHCFGCNKNINNIDLLIKMGYGFVEAVSLLQKWLLLYNTEKTRHKIFSHPANPVENSEKIPRLIGPILLQEFGNRAPPPS